MKYEWTTREYPADEAVGRRLHASMFDAGWRAVWSDGSETQKFVVYRREVREITR